MLHDNFSYERNTKTVNVFNNLKNIPNLRFKEFSGEWIEYKLKDLSELYDGSHASHKNVKEGKYLLSVNNVRDGKVTIFYND